MYLSRDEIEAIGKRVLQAYYRLPSLKDEAIRCIDPTILATELLGLKVEYQTLSRTGNLLGLTAFGEADVLVFDEDDQPVYRHTDGKTVFVDKYMLGEAASAGRLHFTLMHESCHQIYRMLFPWCYADERRERRIHYCRANRSPQDWEEWRTDALAAAILMPPELVVRALAECGINGRIELLNRVYAPRAYTKFAKAAEVLGVSKAALNIRLNQMKLICRNDFKDPYALTGIYAEDGELDD